jgi:hypothetical protein
MPDNRPAAEKNLGVFFNDWRMPVGPTQSGEAHDLEPGPPAGVVIEPTRD